jgi:hypothetical protein
MPSKEVVITFWLDMTAPMSLLSRIAGAAAQLEIATSGQPHTRGACCSWTDEFQHPMMSHKHLAQNARS